MKFGGELRPIRLYTDRQGGTTYTFPSITALLANQPTNIQVLGDTSAPDPWNNGVTGERFLKQYYLIFYAQDEWKIRPEPDDQLRPSLRVLQPLHEDRNLFVLFNADTGKLACGTTPGCDLPNTTPWYHSTKTNFGPRLGLSWSPQKFNSKTVFRVGAGYYYGPGQTEDQVQPIDSDRASRTLTSNIAWPDQSGAGAGRIQHHRSESRVPAARVRQRIHAAGKGALVYGVDSAANCRATRCSRWRMSEARGAICSCVRGPMGSSA